MMNTPFQGLLKGRFAHTIFCDEIRQEVSGKGIFIGVYSSEMYVPSLPLTLPTFTAFVTFQTPDDMPLSKLIVRLVYGEDIIAEAVFPESELEAHFSVPPEPSTDPEPGAFRVFRSSIGMTMAPFVIDKEGILKVRVETESEIVPGGAITIKVSDASGAVASQGG